MAKYCNMFNVKRLLGTPNGQVFEQEGAVALSVNATGQLELEYKTELKSPVKIIFNRDQEIQLINFVTTERA